MPPDPGGVWQSEMADSLWTKMSYWLCGEDGRMQSLQAVSGKRTESMYNQDNLKPPITYHCFHRHRALTLSSCNSTLLCSLSRKPLCLWSQWTSSQNQFRDTELLVCVTLMPVEGALPGIWSQQLMVIKTYVIFVRNTSYVKSSRPSFDQKLWQFLLVYRESPALTIQFA